MSEKSCISREQGVCVVCGRSCDAGGMVFDCLFGASMERCTVTGWGLCPKHLVLHVQGYVALVECDPERSGNPRAGDMLFPERVHRTGPFVHLTREVFSVLFDRPVAPNQPCMYVAPGVVQVLKNMMQHPH